VTPDPDTPTDADAPLAERDVAVHLARHGDYSYSRSSGPGGQRRDKVETRVELRIFRASTDGLPERIAERLTRKLQLDDRPLILRSERERSRERNRAIVLDELTDRVQAALAKPPPPRRPTRPSRASITRRKSEKKSRASTKQLRRRPTDDG